jgi:cob(I)alamin adenosyltransferase
MDKKAKKRLDLIRQRLQKLRQQLAGAKTQMDDPDEVKRLEREIAEAEAEAERLKAGP